MSRAAGLSTALVLVLAVIPLAPSRLAAMALRQANFAALYDTDAPDMGGEPPCDCVMIVRPGALRSSLARDLMADDIPERIRNLEPILIPGGVRIKGTFDGPLFLDPGFSCDVLLRVVDGATIDACITRCKVVNFGINKFSDIVSRLVCKRMRQRHGERMTVEVRGRQEDGSYALRIVVDRSKLAPMLGDKVDLVDCHIDAEGMRFYVTVR